MSRSRILIAVLCAFAIQACSDDHEPTSPSRLQPGARHADIQPTAFTDHFDGPTIDPFWSTFEQYGSLSFTTDHANSAPTSLAFAASAAPSNSGPNMIISHAFGSPTKGTFSVYFYDAAPGQQTLYEMMELDNSTQPGVLAVIGTNDFDALCYASRLDVSPGNSIGEGANCGSFPQAQTTHVQRTLGWHFLTIKVEANDVVFSIDGDVTFTAPGDYAFDSVQIFVSGPYWRPTTTGYFDDFSFTPLAPPAFPFAGFFSPVQNLPTRNAAKSGSAVPLRFSLGGDRGLGVVAPGYPVVQQTSCDTNAPTNDIQETVAAGNSALSYDAATDTYTYVWKTLKSWAGTCQRLTVQLTDGTSHSADFYFK